MKELLWPENIKLLSAAIGQLEQPHYGLLRFTTIGYGESTLNVSIGGWQPVQYLDQIPGLRKLADDLNAACEPVIAAYAKSLRQALANECVKLAEKSLAARDAKHEFT